MRSQEKYPKEGCPADCVPPLRCGQPVVLGHGLHRETHYAPRRSVQTDAVSQFTKQLHSAVQLPSPYPVLLGAFRRDGAQTQAIAYFRRMKLTEQSPCFLHMPAALLGFAGRISPGGRGTFLGDQEKYPKEGRPADCVPSLRCGQPVVLGYGLHRETHYAPEALRSNRRGESVHEAVALFGATAQPIPCAPRRIQKGN